MGGAGARTLAIRSADGTANQFPIVVSANPATHGLMMVRGIVGSMATTLGGEGFSVSRTGTGTYQITYTQAFADAPVAVANATAGGGGYYASTGGLTTASSTVYTFNGVINAANDFPFSFVAIGQRGA